jgi:competence ComEA-like helix-hairpin-helix protein
MWKDFFYYSKSERRAVFVLSLIIVILIIGSFVLPYFNNVSKETLVSEMDRLAFEDKLEQDIKRPFDSSYVQRMTNRQGHSYRLKEFDPNTADSLELSSLGLSPFVVRNVLKYRDKGGVFRSSESFARIYGISDETFLQLKPYISISKEFVRKQESESTVSVVQSVDTLLIVFKYSEGTLVDVGMADTTELKKIPGIGTGIAKAIVSYRNRLGGFYSLDQLHEIKYITPELMKWFKLDSLNLRKISINNAGIDLLRNHPYVNFYQAKVIVEHRKKKGKIKSLSQLSLYEEFTEKDLKRLVYYFIFD